MQYEGVRYTEGSIQIAMTFMDGGSLGDLVAKTGPLPSDALAAITRQVLGALVDLRERHLVHRDLKPQNILLSLNGDVKVSDFGCVAELQDSFGKCGTFVGTVPYMSPERIQGHEYGYASDVWALGLTLHECAGAATLVHALSFAWTEEHLGRCQVLPALPSRLSVLTRIRGWARQGPARAVESSRGTAMELEAAGGWTVFVTRLGIGSDSSPQL